MSRSRKRSLAPLTALMLLVACGRGERAGRMDSARVPPLVDSIVASTLGGGEVAGVSVAILRGDRILLDRGYGFADLARRTPTSRSTEYRIGSLTKQFTAAAILTLAESGRLNLDAPLTEFLPQFDPYGPPVSIRQLLTHTSGIRSFTDFDSATSASFRSAGSHDVLLAAVSGAGRDNAPGNWWHYNNSGYYLLGLVIERVTRHPYAEYLRDSVIARAGAPHVSACELEPVADLATGYVATRRRLDAVGPESLLPSFSAGGLCSTAVDLARWQRQLHAGRVIGSRAHRAMVTPARLADGTPTSYGFGLFVGTAGGHTVYVHNGRVDGFSAQGAYYPDDELSVVILANTESPVAEQLEREISAAILGLGRVATPRAAADLGGRTDRFEGVYHDGPVSIPVWEERGHLVLRAPGGDTVSLRHVAPASFAQEDDPSMTFTFRTLGARRWLVVRRNGMLYAMAESRD